eukprot:scaffold29995_cov71-Phaeocystis_antarctica.AAC.2
MAAVQQVRRPLRRAVWPAPTHGLPQRRPSFHLLRRRVRRARRPVSSGESRHKHFGLCWSQTGHSR